MASIKFKINGKEYEVDGKFGPDVSLNEYIRTVAELRGTKAMCHEGGCGACIVSVRAALPPANEVKTFAVNSQQLLNAVAKILYLDKYQRR